MAKSRNDILFKYLADTKNLEKGNKRVGKSMGGVGETAKAAGKAILGAFAAREVIGFANDAVSAFADYEESINAVEVVTGDAAESILKLGDDSVEAFGVTSTEVNEAAVAFQGFGEKIDAADVGGTFEDFLGRATDFASVMNLEVNDALSKFQSGLAGETEPLRRFGLDLSAAATAAKAVEEGIVGVGEKMSEEEKVQARYLLLMEQTDKTAGDWAATSDSLANSQKKLTARWAEAQRELGKKLAPAMESLLKVSEDLLPVVGNLLGEFGKFVDEANTLLSPILNLTDALGDLNVETEDASFWSKALGDVWSVVGQNVLSAGKDRVIDLRDATIGLHEWLSAADEESERLMDTQRRAADGARILEQNTWDLAGAQLGSAAAADAADEATKLWIDTINTPFPGMEERADAAIARIRAGVLADTQPASVGVNHGGGVVPGAPGSDQLRVLKAGERVIPRQQAVNGTGGGGVTINFNGVVGDPAEVAEQIRDLLEFGGRVNGSD